MKKMHAAQLTFDGSEEAPVLDSGGIREFMRLSTSEEGLLHPAQAALVLDVSNQRVLELIETKRLRSWEFWGRKYLSARELVARRASDVKGGRPKRTVAQRLVSSAKHLAMNDSAQVASAALGR
jgi:excisionase family DNA binding protein